MSLRNHWLHHNTEKERTEKNQNKHTRTIRCQHDICKQQTKSFHIEFKTNKVPYKKSGIWLCRQESSRHSHTLHLRASFVRRRKQNQDRRRCVLGVRRATRRGSGTAAAVYLPLTDARTLSQVYCLQLQPVGMRTRAGMHCTSGSQGQ